jgi:hypothetical protein
MLYDCLKYAALTDRKKKEIMAQYREMMAKRGYRVFLNVFCDINSLEETFTIPQNITDSLRKVNSVSDFCIAILNLFILSSSAYRSFREVNNLFSVTIGSSITHLSLSGNTLQATIHYFHHAHRLFASLFSLLGRVKVKVAPSFPSSLLFSAHMLPP